MSASLRIVYLAHAVRSDWNNGNAHFLRGLMRGLARLGQEVTIFEPESAWSIENLRLEPVGERSLAGFASAYPELDVRTYESEEGDEQWAERLRGADIVIFHEWNAPALARRILQLRERLGFALLFHDTHHRASSSPEQMEAFGLEGFDGIIAFGEVLRSIYRDRFGLTKVWMLHEAADTTIFQPLSGRDIHTDAVWIGNWGDGERSVEIREFFLEPVRQIGGARSAIYGVRYPLDGLEALGAAGVRYGGYLPNLEAPEVYARSRLTVHIPRKQYSGVMRGIPTIRVFEALACGIPLLSAPWLDTEKLFREGDFRFACDGAEMFDGMRYLLANAAAAEDQAGRGLETVLARHTCAHRAQELMDICHEVRS